MGGFSWSDAPLHAMDGVFIYDFVHALPISNAKQWAYQYYARYPSLGLIVFYPPFFAIVEACVYALLGISVFAARFTVIVFAVIAFWSIYLIAKMLFDKTSALLAAGIWATLPATVVWSRMVMLEIPTTAIILAGSFCYLKYRESEHIRWLAMTAIFVVIAFMTKQWAIFIAGVFLIDLLMQNGWKKTFSQRNIIAACLAAGVIVGYMIFSSRYAALSKLLVRGNHWRHLFQIESWLFYIKSLPEIFGIPALCLAVAGLLIAIVYKQIRAIRIAILWAGIFYLFATVIAYKEVRYFYFITPAGVLIAVGGLSATLKQTNLARTGQILLGVLLGLQTVNALRISPERLNDYSQAANLIVKRNDANLVLVDATREGQFIFDMRRLQGSDGRIFILRGSKLLYSRAARRRWRYQEHIKTQADILQLIRRYAIRYIVVESTAPDVPDWQDYFPPPSQKLRRLLRKKKLFRKLAEFPVSPRREDKIWGNVKLQVYRYRGRLKRKSETIKIPIPSMGRDIYIKLR